MLKDHLDVCREEDDETTTLIELKNFTHYDSEESEEFEEETNVNIEADIKKENAVANDTRIRPVADNECHCCGEDLKIAHTGGKFKCSECDLSFKKSASLERHSTVIHWGIDSCACNDCGATFNDKKSLDKHRYTSHSDAKIHR